MWNNGGMPREFVLAILVAALLIYSIGAWTVVAARNDPGAVPFVVVKAVPPAGQLAENGPASPAPRVAAGQISTPAATATPWATIVATQATRPAPSPIATLGSQASGASTTPAPSPTLALPPQPVPGSQFAIPVPTAVSSFVPTATPSPGPGTSPLRTASPTPTPYPTYAAPSPSPTVLPAASATATAVRTAPTPGSSLNPSIIPSVVNPYLRNGGPVLSVPPSGR